MIRTAALCLLFALTSAGPATAWGQTMTSEGAGPTVSRPGGPEVTMSLEQAIDIALRHNRLIRNDQLEVEKAVEGLEVARSRRRPQFEFEFIGLQTITPVEFRFDRGSLGSLPGGSPFPLQDVRIGSSNSPNALLTARVTQPLTQLRRINLGVRLREVGREIAENKLEAQRLAVINQVKRSYYAVLQTESALASIRESIKLRRELDRVVNEYVMQKVALAADGLDVKTGIANDEYEATKLRNALGGQKEQLNLLLGRDLRTEFAVAPTTEIAFAEFDLAAAQGRALGLRAEIKEAQLKRRQAEYGRRIRKADSLPDVSLTLGYFSPFGVALAPRNVAAVGVTVKWEPFDWGRRKRELAEADKTIEQADNGLRETEAQVLLDVSNRFRKLQETRALLAVTGASQRAAQEKLRVATNKFKQEAVLFKDVLQTQAAVADADHQHQQALLAFLTARADFEKAVGDQ
jgi:outer membrane protein TolC